MGKVERSSREGTCRLCGKYGPLCNSHILPEFLYKPIYDEKGRAIAVSRSNDGKTRYIQKGIRERLLCEGCEGNLSKHERYAKRILYAQEGEGESLQVTSGNGVKTFHGVSYSSFKLFQLSLLWRSGVSTLPEFQAVSFGGKHESRLRKMILEEDPGAEWEYGCVIAMLRMNDEELLDIIMTPERTRFGSYNCYNFFMAGGLWIYAVGKNTATFPLRDSFLKSNGDLSFFIGEAWNIPYVREVISEFLGSS